MGAFVHTRPIEYGRGDGLEFRHRPFREKKVERPAQGRVEDFRHHDGIAPTPFLERPRGDPFGYVLGGVSSSEG